MSTRRRYSAVRKCRDPNTTPEKSPLVVSAKRKKLSPSTSDSLFFTSSEQDKEAVEIITKNLSEFATLAVNEGFQLSVQYESATNIIINLKPSQTSNGSDFEKVSRKLENLIEVKKVEVEGVESRLDRLTSSISSMQISMENKLESAMTAQMVPITYLTEELDKKQQQIDDLRKSVKQLLSNEQMIDYFDEDSFLNQEQLRMIRGSARIMDRMCDRVCVEGSFSSNPYSNICAMTVKRGEMRKLLDYMQMDWSTARRDYIRREVLRWLRDEWTAHSFLPTDWQRDEARERMRTQFHVDNVVGSVHSIPVRLRNGRDFFMFMAIMDKQIVEYSLASTRESALNTIYEYLKEDEEIDWTDENRFATNFRVPPNVTELFIHVDNDDLFVDNERVVTFMKNNFECLQHFMPENSRSIIPSVYNMLYYLF